MLWTIIGIMVFIILLIGFLPLWISIIVFPLEIIAFLINKREEKRRIEEEERNFRKRVEEEEFLRQQKLKEKQNQSLYEKSFVNFNKETENHQNEQNLLPNESEESENNSIFWSRLSLGFITIFCLALYYFAILHK